MKETRYFIDLWLKDRRFDYVYDKVIDDKGFEVYRDYIAGTTMVLSEYLSKSDEFKEIPECEAVLR